MACIAGASGNNECDVYRDTTGRAVWQITDTTSRLRRPSSRLKPRWKNSDDVDIRGAEGVINATFSNGVVFVFSRQPPTEQLWLATPGAASTTPGTRLMRCGETPAVHSTSFLSRSLSVIPGCSWVGP